MEEESYTIRPAKLQEAEEVAAIWALMAEEHKTYDDDFWCWDKNAVETWRERFKELLEQQDMVTLVAEASSGGLAGFAVAAVKAAGSAVFSRPRGEVWDLVIRPEHRGKGLGSRLMEAVFESLKALGVEEAVLHVALANPTAIRFYEKLGMRPMMYRMHRRL